MKKIVIGRSFGFGFVQILGILGDVAIATIFGLKNFTLFRWFRIRYRKNLVQKSIRLGIEKIRY